MSKINAKHKKDKHLFFFHFRKTSIFSDQINYTVTFFPNSGIWILVNVAFVDVHENPNYETPADRRSMLQDPF